jgi:pyruvate dehydrogenase (quinone)
VTTRSRWGRAWREALAADGPVVLEFKVDQEIAPLLPRIMMEQGKKAAKAWVKDPERSGIAVRGFRQKLAEFYEALPGRGQ